MSVQPPVPPSSAPITLPREVYELLTLVDLTRTGRRVLDILLAHQSEQTGAAKLSQAEMCAILGASKPSVNRGFRELREIGLAWAIEDALYQLHPLLTGGRSVTRLAAVPKIKVPAVEEVGEQRRQRYAAQLASLGLSA
ncbi:hypothetical protein KV557_24600 [Kitasatospora aureofaciens]|uniref:hypothetical protein n=1 Tax=Kitasatospora aureofaciens TaxID=1894 RepID=UPI001C44D1A3|nr:hypothetical protein [Kitasatospora aureofaciens]MBV6700245.1 hypothetical protein [Kitasatospora aureofaciens]